MFGKVQKSTSITTKSELKCLICEKVFESEARLKIHRQVQYRVTSLNPDLTKRKSVCKITSLKKDASDLNLMIDCFLKREVLRHL